MGSSPGQGVLQKFLNVSIASELILNGNRPEALRWADPPSRESYKIF
jgi:hypothetical protein